MTKSYENLTYFTFYSLKIAQNKGMTKQRISFLLKIATFLSAFFGVSLSLVFAKREGYFPYHKRLLYFTDQSNLWIGVLFLSLLLCRNPSWKKRLYLLKYIFTVSITVTGLVFCCLLAPFADESYTPWTLCNLFTHVFTPLLAIVDFFLDDYPIFISKTAVFASLLPPFCYLVEALLLETFYVDFGRGVPYPYFFLNYRSPAGVFGFSGEYPFFLGAFYWLILFLLLVLGLAVFFARQKKKRR